MSKAQVNNNLLNWNEYFMALAKISALRSKDPNTKVGAVIVNPAKRVIALGYNGMPQGNDEDFPWVREASSLDQTKYPYVIHAELNAILNSTTSLDGSTLYVTLFPCSSCAKIVAQSGVRRLVYVDDKYKDTPDDKIAKKIFQIAKVEMEQIKDFDVQVTK